MRNNGLSENTIISVGRMLRVIGKHADLMKPEQIKEYLATATKKDGTPLKNSSKTRYVYSYERLMKVYNLKWDKPEFRFEEHVPLIPSTENISKIIGASTRRYATIFTLLAEIGLSGHELHKLSRKDIDTEKGIVRVRGYKGHASGTYKLKRRTLEMLREYLAKDTREHPFPRPKTMAEMWTKFKTRVADKLKQPELKYIQLRNLRNYSGAKVYNRLKDVIAVQRHLRHKRIETTMHYIRAIDLGEEEEFIVKTASNLKEATELIENGFEYVTEMDNVKIFRKRK
ncbi:MAG: site-specific integrase [Candidatus Bathyarchaeota archaeon]|nr:site-specific integrase [Candidatus Bathyarchaeota archaeon]